MNTTLNTTEGVDDINDDADEHFDHHEVLTGFDRNEPPTKHAYNISYSGGTLNVANKTSITIANILSMDAQTVAGFKATVEAIACSGSRSPSTLAAVIRKLEKGLREVPITSFTSENYQLLVKNANNETANTFRNLLNLWYRLGYPGVDSDTIDIVNRLRRPARKSRQRVISDDATEGWYTDQEYEDLVDCYWNDYEAGRVSLRSTAARLLNAQFGRRGVQLAGLKIMDLEFEGETDGISGRRIAFPGAKDRGAEEWFRGSKVDVHPLGDDLWKLCELQAQSSIRVYEAKLGRTLSELERKQLPFFESAKFPKKYSEELRDPNFPFITLLPTAHFHLNSPAISQLLVRTTGTPVISHRTGEPIREFGYRMRYTRARQLARLGVPRLTLQYWLGHEDRTSLEHYYSDPAEEARQLNEEVKLILGPLAQAFAGTVRDKESEASRGSNPASRVELDGRLNVGSCGLHGYCSASVPIPCYHCAKFEPWVHGPHDEVLIRLIERQEEENNIHLPSKARRILTPLQLKKDIQAVKLVIRLCDARKREMAQAQNRDDSSDSAPSSAAMKGENRQQRPQPEQMQEPDLIETTAIEVE
jgi:integrase